MTIFRVFGTPQQSPVTPKGGCRAPSNVPYYIDNIWEWLRPAGHPSRRSAVFASPSAALARECFSGDEAQPHVYSVELPTNYAAAQIVEGSSPKDARGHDDIRNLRKLVMAQFGRQWLTRSLDQKGPEGLLFMPCLAADEVAGIIARSSLLDETEIRKSCNFWNTVRYCDWRELDHPEGEIFFEAPQDGYKVNKI